MDLCPNASLIISIDTPLYLAIVAQEWRNAYEVTGDFNVGLLPVLSNRY